MMNLAFAYNHNVLDYKLSVGHFYPQSCSVRSIIRLLSMSEIFSSSKSRTRKPATQTNDKTALHYKLPAASNKRLARSQLSITVNLRGVSSVHDFDSMLDRLRILQYKNCNSTIVTLMVIIDTSLLRIIQYAIAVVCAAECLR